MRYLTLRKLYDWRRDSLKLLKTLEGKTDSVSNAMRITTIHTVEQITLELRRRNAYGGDNG
jgi:hypothetical protein